MPALPRPPEPQETAADAPPSFCQGGCPRCAEDAAWQRLAAPGEDAVRELLRSIGEDPNRPGLLETPARVMKAWGQYWGAGYRMDPPKLSSFPEEGVDYNQMIVVDGLDFWSTCEHHLAPFFGSATIAYLPDARRGLLGLSKFARVIDYFARRLQVQERLTAQIADFLVEHVSDHVGVMMRATHFCMVSRGVQRSNSRTTTTALRGSFLIHDSVKSEFLRVAGGAPKA